MCVRPIQCYVLFQAEYLEIARVLTNYPVKLLDRVKGNEELDVLLNHTTGATGDGYEKLTRLRLAIHYNEKKVSYLQITVRGIKVVENQKVLSKNTFYHRKWCCCIT